MIHSIIDIIVGLVLWKFIPYAVGLKDRGIERFVKVVLMIVTTQHPLPENVRSQR